MRLFVALEIPEPVRREVSRRMAGLRERLPKARWVDPAAIHLTLVFLGEVADAKDVDRLAAALRAAFAPFPPMTLRLSEAGTFPPGRPARVAWLGVDAPDELEDLQAAAVRAAAEAVGHEPEDRPYHPHVTLARCPSPWGKDIVAKLSAAFPAEVGPPFAVDRGVLMESKLSPRGARYRVVVELPLQGGEP